MLLRLAPGLAPSFALTYTIAGVFAGLGFLLGFLTIRARRIWIVLAAVPLFSNGSLLVLPFVLGEHPPDDDQVALARYGAWLIAYFGVTCLIWLSAALSAVFVMRNARKQLVEDQKENVQTLVEETLRDHERKQ